MFKFDDRGNKDEPEITGRGSTWRTVTAWAVALWVAIVIMVFLRHAPVGADMRWTSESRTYQQYAESANLTAAACSYGGAALKIRGPIRPPRAFSMSIRMTGNGKTLRCGQAAAESQPNME